MKKTNYRGARRFGAAGAMLATAALLVSCSAGGGDTAGGDSGDEEIRIAWVVGNTQDGFYQKATQGALEEAEELGITLINQGPDAYDPTKQIPVVDALLAETPDALVVAPTDPEALRAPLKRWSDAGIPIVVFDTAISEDPGFELVSWIGSDNYGGGQMAAEAMAENIGGSGEVAIIDLNTSDKTLTARADGFQEKLSSDFPDIEVIDLQYTELDFPKAQTLAQTFVNKHANLAGIFTTYSFATQYAAKGLQDLGKAGEITLVGFEAGEKEIQGIEDGSIQALVVQQPAEQGRMAVRAAYNYITGNEADVEREVMLENVLITADNLNEMTQYFYKVD